jgi:DNA-binding LytR/AlgR family response regulator
MPKAVIAEDEALLRAELVSQLRRAWPELEIAAECEDGASALDAIDVHRPEVAFLDIRMPGITGSRSRPPPPKPRRRRRWSS